jgi:NAD(P)-dependent dehydrogenase (short-subunit alcohol dehydrogenase family)
MSEFQDKVAIVTGAGSGIGREIAQTFAEEGTKVIVADVSVEAAQETVDQIEAVGGDAIVSKTDVSNPRDVEEMVGLAVDTYGRLDYAINNAGIGNTPAPITDIPVEEWDQVIDVNQKGVWLSMKYEIPEMLSSGGGAIVNTASTAGIAASPGRTPYGASKHAVVGLTRSVAQEFAEEGIRVNAICPTIIETPAIESMSEEERQSVISEVPMKRLGQPKEVADSVLWLCSEESSFVTGHAMPIDGGETQ